MLVLLALTACSNIGSPTFAGGGHRYTSGELGAGGSVAGSGDDTGDTSDTGTLPEGSSYLADLVLLMQTGSDSVTGVLGSATVVDSEGDVLGGTAYVDWYTYGSSTTSDTANLEITTSSASSGDFAYLTGDSLVFYVSPVTPTEEYIFVVQIRDASGNVSNAVEGTVGPE